ncbi:MAG: hypothetical protein U0586_00690 [Candidatus Brocadiaceae bacterium]
MLQAPLAMTKVPCAIKEHSKCHSFGLFKLDTGCDAYMSKPINTQELPLIVEKYIKKND